MTERRPLVRQGGRNRQLPPGDTLPMAWDELKTVAAVSGVATLDLSSPAGFRVSLTGDTALVFSNVPTGRVVVFTVTFVQDSPGGRVVAFPANVKADTGAAPAQPATAPGSVTVQSFYIDDGGATIWQAATLDGRVTVEVPVNAATVLSPAAFAKMHVCSSGAAGYTVELPPVSDNAGKMIGIRVSPTSTGFVTIDGSGSELIDGQQTRKLWATEVAVLLCDGTAWIKVAGKSRAMACEMYPSAAVSVASSVNTKVPLELVVKDTSGAVADTVNKRMNIPRTGLYRVQGIVYYQAGTQPMKPNHVRIHVNGTVAPSGLNIQAMTVAAEDAYFNQHDVVLSLTAGDYVELYAFQASTSGVARSLYVGNTAWSYLALVEHPSW